MTIALRREHLARPNTSFGPFRFLGALPWLVLATAMRILAYGGSPIALPAIIVANISVLLAFVLVTRRSIELANGQTSLGSLTVVEQLKLSGGILGRIFLMMLAATLAVMVAGYTKFAPNMMLGLDGMAFDQFTTIGKFWSAAVASLVLLMMIGADSNNGKIGFFSAVDELGRRIVWIGAAVLSLGVIYVGLGYVQGVARYAVWVYGQAAPHGHFVRNIVAFVFIFSFAMLRLWITLLVLTYGVKLSYRYG